jgi:hypothetical protein
MEGRLKVISVSRCLLMLGGCVLLPRALACQVPSSSQLSALPAVLEVASGPQSASGYVVDRVGGFIVTNAHAVYDDSVIVYVTRKRAVTARKLAVDTQADLAILQVAAEAVQSVAPLQLRMEPPVLGEPVLAVGFPLRRERTITRGIVASVSDGALFVDALINPGNSGGPVLDSLGQVMGTVSFLASDPMLGPGLGAAVSNAPLAALLGAARQRALDLPVLDTLPPVVDRPAWRMTWDEVRRAATEYGTLWYADWDSFRAGPFDIELSTSAAQWAEWSAQDSLIGLERSRRDRKAAGSSARYSRVASLRNWEQFVGDQLSPVVVFAINPRISERASSLIGNLLLGLTIGITGPQVLSYAGDLFAARLLRDGQPIRKVSGGHSPQRIWIESRWLQLRDVADFGYYVFPAEAFAPRPDRTFPTMVLEAVDRRTLKAHKLQLSDITVARIWADFDEAYRIRFPERAYHGVRLVRKCVEMPGSMPLCESSASVVPASNR